MICETDQGVEIAVWLVPRSRKTRLLGVHNNQIKIAVTAPPVDGAANKAVIQALSRWLGLAKGRITLITGAESRRKTINLAGMERGEVEKWLAAQARA